MSDGDELEDEWVGADRKIESAQDWEACTDVGRLWWHAGNVAPTRKWLLFAAACGREVWHLLRDPASRVAVEAAEACADGLVSEGELRAALRRAAEVSRGMYDPAWRDWEYPPELWAALAVDRLSFDPESDDDNPPGYSFDSHNCAIWALAQAAPGGNDPEGDAYPRARVRASRRLARLFRCIMGNPYRPVDFRTEWRSADAVGLARAVYDEEAFDRLPILADALEDAGCADEQVLAHCRGPGPHVRGCWVVDRVLGKQ